jgi:hypothetical protein
MFDASGDTKWITLEYAKVLVGNAYLDGQKSKEQGVQFNVGPPERGAKENATEATLDAPECMNEKNRSPRPSWRNVIICGCYCTGDRGCSCCNKTCGHWTATASPEEIEQWLIAR